MRKANDNKILKLVAVILVLVFLVSSSLLLLEVWEKRQARFPTTDTQQTVLNYNGLDYVLKDNIETFLVMGLDKFEGSAMSNSYNNDKQADFLMLFVFDNATKKYATIHVNRDSMVNVNILGVAGNKIGTVEKQIALAHTYGNGKDVSCRNVADAVSELLLGTRVNHYASVTMDSVATMNDFVGGVEVTVLDDFTGIDNTLVKGQTVTLMGDQALNYIRTRQGLEDSSNSTRMNRQQQYLRALHAKFKQCAESDEQFVVNAALEMSSYIVSDRSVTQLQEIIEKLNEYEFVGNNVIDGKTELGDEFIEFYPDENSIKKTVVELFYKPKD